MAVDGASRLEKVIVCVTDGITSLVVCAVYLPPNTVSALYEQHAACINEPRDTV